MRSGRAFVMCSWEEVPHLSDDEKARLRRDTPAYQRKAREHGIPELGAGAIYPIDEDELKVDPFPIPRHFWRGYGFDTGWNWTAALSGAWDRDADIIYLTHCYKVGQKEPAVHAAAIKGMMSWQVGAVDPSAKGAGKVRDGEGIMKKYQDLGLVLMPADNAVEAGILDVYDRKTTGRLKVFSTLTEYFQEHRLYRRNDKGQVVKENDHIMDCERYLIRTPEVFSQEPTGAQVIRYSGSTGGSSQHSAQQTNPHTRSYGRSRHRR